MGRWLLCVFAVVAMARPGFCADEKRASAKEMLEASKQKEFPERPWDKAFEYNSKHYHVVTNTSRALAQYVGYFMDAVHRSFCDFFGYDETAPLANIYVYATEKEFKEVARKHGMPDWTSGFFSYTGERESAIYLPWKPDERKTPQHILLHEGTHQFIWLTQRFPIPAGCKAAFGPNVTELQVVPLWLNEGFATFLEEAEFDGKDLVTGQVSRSRLSNLKQLMKTDRLISFEDLFRVTHDDWGEDHYAPSWGVAYWFLQDKNLEVRKKRKAVLIKYLKTCRKGFFADPDKEFAAKFVTDGAAPKDFWKQWEAHCVKAGFDAFRKMTVGSSGTFEKWQEEWRIWVTGL